MKRRDFPSGTIYHLAKRAGFSCSNPQCRVSAERLYGAGEGAAGVATQISAAPVNGLRLAMHSVNDVADAIWLCTRCARLTERDKLPEGILRQWKEQVEAEVLGRVNHTPKGPVSTGNITPFVEPDLLRIQAVKINRGFVIHTKNASAGSDHLFTAPSRRPLIRWKLYWRFNLALYNNADHPAFNIAITQLSDNRFSFLEQLKPANELGALEYLNLRAEQLLFLEGTEAQAERLLQEPVPEALDGLKLKISYTDKLKRAYTTLATFAGGRFVCVKL
jgi:hypothetical protein